MWFLGLTGNILQSGKNAATPVQDQEEIGPDFCSGVGLVMLMLSPEAAVLPSFASEVFIPSKGCLISPVRDNLEFGGKKKSFFVKSQHFPCMLSEYCSHFLLMGTGPSLAAAVLRTALKMFHFRQVLRYVGVGSR